MIPDFQSIMLPLLKLFSDKEEHTIREFIDKLAEKFNLTDEARKKLLSSGRQTVFYNRVTWARIYLTKTGLLENPRRAVYKITERGLNVLSQNPPAINIRYLKDQFPNEMREFYKPKSSLLPDTERREGESSIENERLTPIDNIENTYQGIRNSLAEELLNKVLELSPTFFERLVIDLLVKMGYGGTLKEAGNAVGKSGDEGIDGIIKEDKLGLDIIYIQAKRWQKTNIVGRPEIQKFVGALAGKGAKKGVFITTSSFTREAIGYVEHLDSKVILVDGKELSELMIDNNIGVSTEATYEIKKIDTDYFSEE
ncbi:restriction endonuclease [bacterium]|nr:restriction endonuclease [bacterium]